MTINRHRTEQRPPKPRVTARVSFFTRGLTRGPQKRFWWSSSGPGQYCTCRHLPRTTIYSSLQNLAPKPSTKPRQKSTKCKGFEQMVCRGAIYSGPGHTIPSSYQALSSATYIYLCLLRSCVMPKRSLETAGDDGFKFPDKVYRGLLRETLPAVLRKLSSTSVLNIICCRQIVQGG